MATGGMGVNSGWAIVTMDMTGASMPAVVDSADLLSLDMSDSCIPW